jgi:DNA polymerase elongation subunit (family B)
MGDPVIQIGVTLAHEKHLFVWPDCAPLDGIVLHVYETEAAMIHAWFKWLVALNPDILIGYNVFGFDERYLWARAEVLGLVGPLSPLHGLSRTGEAVKCEEKRLSSSALGDNFMYIWSASGRLQIDLYHYIKRSASLPSYKLDEVAKHYLSGSLKGYGKGADGSLVLTLGGAVKDLRPGRALCLLDETGESMTDKMVIRSVEAGGKVTVGEVRGEDGEVLDEAELAFATKWVIVKDDISPADIFRLHRGSAADRALVGKYCLQDCDLVLELYKKLEVFNNSMSMANVCSAFSPPESMTRTVMLCTLAVS